MNMTARYMTVLMVLVAAWLLWPCDGAAQAPAPVRQLLQPGGEKGGPSQDVLPAPVPVEERIQALAERVAEVRNRLASANEQGEAGLAAEYHVTREEARKRIQLLQRLEYIYDRHIDAIKQAEEIRKSSQDLDAEIAAWEGFAENPPYTIDFVDDIRDQVHAKDVEINALRWERESREKLLNDATDRLPEAEQVAGEAAEAYQQADTTMDRVKLQWVRERAALDVRFLEVQIAALQAQLSQLGDALALARRGREFLQQKLELAAANAPFLQDEYDAKIAAIDEQSSGVQREAEQASNRLVQVRGQLADAREALRAAREEAGANGDVTEQQKARLAHLQREVDVSSAQADTVSAQTEVLKASLGTLEVERQVWSDRYQMYRVGTPEQVNAALASLEQRETRLYDYRPYLNEMERLARSLVAGQEQRLEDWEEGDGDRGLERQLLKTYEDRVDVYQRAQERVATLERLMTRFRQELEARRTDVPFADRLLARLRTLGNVVSKVWNYEVFKVEDTVVVDGQEITHSRGISVQKIVVALIILAVGWLAARYIARRARRFVMSRFHADAGVASQVQKGVFYVLAVLVVFVALTTVEIPLTVFAYLGGALAIGVGFGAQNLINNFISGLILLMERPIKVGDIVDVDGIRGRVVNIGSRCSQVRRFDGIDMLVPNSSFLEKNVTNWTLSDLVIRFSVSVGVAYGSPIREVSHLIRKAVEEHGKVLKDPEPVIVFEEFGDNALVFTAYFWLEVTTMMDQRIVASDIRFRIDKLFREAGICIAFPQRDVHLDSQRPVQIELVRPRKSAEGGSSPLPGTEEKPGDGGG